MVSPSEFLAVCFFVLVFFLPLKFFQGIVFFFLFFAMSSAYTDQRSSGASTLALPPPTMGKTPEMRLAFSKLNQISRDCGVNPEEADKKAQAAEQEAKQLENMTPFRRIEFLTAKNIKELRDEIRMLNSMENNPEYSKADCDRLRQTIRRRANELGKNNREVMRLAKAEKCESEAMLLLGHVDKAKGAFRAKFNQGYTPSVGGRSSGYQETEHEAINSVNSFQDYGSQGTMGKGDQASLREDEEFQQFFVEVQQRDSIMDKQLDRIYQGVQRLHANAQDIKQELELQDRLIDDVTDRIDATTGRLQVLNKRLIKTIKEVDKSRMCIYIFCFVVLLGLVGGILYETGIFNKK